jgi:hypothetical protein
MAAGSYATSKVASAISLYLVLACAYLALTPPARLAAHSPYNHHTLQARAWLDGRLDLGGPPPRYTANNDFVHHRGRYFVSFPPVPAALLLPAVAIAGRPERVREPALFAAVAPLGPTFFFLALECLRRAGRTPRRTRRDLFGLSLLLGLGTVYWFCALQGSVWFIGHVVALVFAAAFLWASVGARQPMLAGACLALAVGTRPTVGLAAPLFLYEVWRAHAGDRATIGRKLASFVAPLVVVGAILGGYNHVRFADPFEFGHRLLDVRWRERIARYGLFDLHFLPRNLTVALGGVPFPTAGGWKINAHGLALWLTSPFLVFALPRRRGGDRLARVALATALVIATVTLLYQNTGWVQFGQRFANDYLWLVVLAIAVGGRRLGRAFWLLGALAMLVNAVGAVSFGRERFAGLYYLEPTQRVLIWPGGPLGPDDG